jgi:hypothetical protein
MNTKTLYRSSGIALILGGLLAGVGWALHHNEVAGYTIVTARWSAAHLAAGLGLLITLPGLFGVFSRQNERASFLGLLGFILAVLSTAVVGAASLMLEGLLAPSLASRGIALEEFLVPGQPLFLGFLITLLLLASGYVILGIVTFRVNALCWLASLLLVISAPMIVLGLTILPMVVFRVGGAIFGVALIRLGTVLWATADIPTERFLSERLAPA